MQKQRSTTWIIVAGILAGWGSFVVSTASGFVQTRLLLNYLSDSQAGVWFVFLSLLGYMALFDFGAGVTLSRYIAFARSNKFPQGWKLDDERATQDPQQAAIADLIVTVSQFYLLIALAVVIVAEIGGLIFLPFITKQSLSTELIITWSVATLTGGFILANIAPSATLFGSNALHYQQSIAAISRLSALGLSALLLYLGWGVIGVAVAFLFQSVFALIANWGVVFYFHPYLRQKSLGKTQTGLIKVMLLPSLRMGLITFANAMALQTDNVMISLRMGPQFVTNYSVTFQLVYILHSLALVISGPFVALSAQAHAEKSQDRLRSLLEINLRFGIAFMAVGSALFALFGESIITLWVGSGRFVGHPVMWLIICVMLLQVHTIIHFRIITATDYIPFTLWTIGAAALNLVVSFFLVDWWGWFGAILGTLIAQGLTNFWVIPFYTHRSLKVPLSNYIRWIIPPLLLSVVILAVGWLMGKMYSFTMTPLLPWQQILLEVITVGAIAVGGFFFAILHPEERMALAHRLTSRLPRWQLESR